MKQWVRVVLQGVCLGASVVLTACVTTQGGSGFADGNPVAVQAMSQQTPQTEQRKRAKTHTELGELYATDRRFAVALDEARTAINADSGYAPAYGLQGLVHMFLGDYAQADDAFKHALSIAPNDPEINNNYGWFLCQTGHEAESLPRFRLAYRNTLYTTPTRPYMNTGICLLRMKDYKGAEDNLNIALRYDPSNTLARYWLAETFYRADRLDEARQQVVDLTRMVEPTVELVWLGARIEHKAGDRDAELKYTIIMRRKFQDTPQYQAMLKGQFE